MSTAVRRASFEKIVERIELEGRDVGVFFEKGEANLAGVTFVGAFFAEA